MSPSRFSGSPDAWDISLTDTYGNVVGLMLVRSKDVAMWEGTDAPALETQQTSARERAVQWRNGSLGAGISIRLPEASGTGPDGQILSLGYGYGEFVTTVVDGIAMPSGKLTKADLPSQLNFVGRIFSAQEYGGDLYFSTQTQYLLRVTGGSGAYDVINLGANYDTSSLQVFDGKLYVAAGSTGFIWEYDGTTWVQSTDVKRSRFGSVYWMVSNQLNGGAGGGTGAYRLLGTDPNGLGFFHIAQGDDPKVDANWSSIGGNSIPVGDGTHPVQNIVASEDVAWFATPTGVFGVNELGRNLNLTKWFERTYDANNGGVVDYYSDESQAIVFVSHQQGLVAVTVNGTSQDTARFVQFGAKGPNLTPVWGRPRWFTPTVDGLFVAYFDGTDSYVMRLIFNKDGSYRWSGAEAVIRNEEVTYMRVASPNGKPRLWIGTIRNSDSVPQLYWQSLPESGNPYVDWVTGTDHRFTAEWMVRPPRENFGSSYKKTSRRYDIVAKNLQAGGGSVAVSASADDSAFVFQGSATSSPRSTFLASSGYETGVNFDWRLDVTGSETQPVILESFQARASVLPEEAPVWNFRCQLAPNQGLLNDAEDTDDPFTKWLQVRSLQRKGPIMMRSPLSNTPIEVKVEQPTPIQMVWGDHSGEQIMTMVLTVSVLKMSAFYQAGFLYGTGAEFG